MQYCNGTKKGVSRSDLDDGFDHILAHSLGCPKSSTWLSQSVPHDECFTMSGVVSAAEMSC